MVFHHGGGYKPSTLKSNLKMAVTRLAISSNKKTALLKQQIREIASMLAENPPREEKARIRAESIIREDNTIEAYEILSLHCDLICERINLISHTKNCPPDLLSCVSTLLWASCVVDIPELQVVRTQFRYKYGKDFELHALQNVNGVVNDRVAKKLSVLPPPAREVQLYLEKIAKEQEVDWKPKEVVSTSPLMGSAIPSSGYSVPTRGGSGLFPSNYNVEEVTELRMHAAARRGGRRIDNDDEYDNNDWDHDGSNYLGLDGSGGGIGPSAPPLSPMTVNTTLPEAPRNNHLNYCTTTKQGKSRDTTNTFTTMASTTAAPSSSASMSTGSSPYVPVLPEPCSSLQVSSLKTDGRNGNHHGNDDEDGDMSRSGLIAEATRMNKEYEDLIARFEQLNKKI